ncbi:MAG: hypothetical protein EU529_04325 [Promethearchaeota archaeon]|nr:MAG: hypothetical protein EU529_04325 [Candidatus Lokiarchaeota archaeon]
MARKEIESEFGTKIKEIQRKFRGLVKNLEVINDDTTKSAKKRKNVQIALKTIKKEVNHLLKRKNRQLNKTLKQIHKEKKKKVKKTSKIVKDLHIKLKVLEAKKFAEKWRKWASYSKEFQKST